MGRRFGADELWLNHGNSPVDGKFFCLHSADAVKGDIVADSGISQRLDVADCVCAIARCKLRNQ